MCIMFSNVICLYASKWGDTWALLLFDTTTSRCYQTRLSHTLHFKAIIPKISHSEEEPLTWMSCPFFNLQPRCQIDWQRLKNKVLWLKCHSTPKERSVRHKINVTSYSIYIIFWAAPFFKTVGGDGDGDDQPALVPDERNLNVFASLKIFFFTKFSISTFWLLWGSFLSPSMYYCLSRALSLWHIMQENPDESASKHRDVKNPACFMLLTNRMIVTLIKKRLPTPYPPRLAITQSQGWCVTRITCSAQSLLLHPPNKGDCQIIIGVRNCHPRVPELLNASLFSSPPSFKTCRRFPCKAASWKPLIFPCNFCDKLLIRCSLMVCRK